MAGLIGFLLGASWGAFVARRRGGNRLDILQYAAVHGLLLALLAYIASVFAIRMDWV